MTVFLAPTFQFFGPTGYQKWKTLHAVSAVAVIFGMVHAVPLGPPGGSLRAVWLVYGGLAIAAFVYRNYVAPRTARHGYTVTRVETVNRGVVELTLKPDEKLLEYRPGQFVYLTPRDPTLAVGCGEEHPYTVSSAPHETVLRIAIKDAGNATRSLQTVSVGSRAMIEGPYGDFFSERKTSAPALWIAGGIGIAPFLSRARSLNADGQYDIHLIYCVQDESRAHFIAELEEIAARMRGFKLTRHFFAVEGALTAGFIEAACSDYNCREIYICGPPPLIAALERDLKHHGVSGAHVHTEDFAWL
jgi:predicted ferric reductase